MPPRMLPPLFESLYSFLVHFPCLFFSASPINACSLCTHMCPQEFLLRVWPTPSGNYSLLNMGSEKGRILLLLDPMVFLPCYVMWLSTLVLDMFVFFPKSLEWFFCLSQSFAKAISYECCIHSSYSIWS